MRYLAVDYGDKRTGLAICDPMEIVVSPYGVLSTDASLLSKLLEVIKTEQVEQLVIGLPLNMDDSEGGQAKKVRYFADKLSKSIDIQINFQDERLSSYKADQMLEPTGFHWRKKKKFRDSLAALAILQAFLDQKSSPSSY